MITDYKKATKFIILIAFGFIISVIIFGLATYKRFENYNEINKNSGIEGVVESVRKYKSSAIIELEKKVYILYGSDNFNYSPPFINEFIQKGDVLHKSVGSDSLFIKREGEEYYFILGKTINKK